MPPHVLKQQTEEYEGVMTVCVWMEIEHNYVTMYCGLKFSIHPS
jgi:hypothetical protein